MSGYWMVTRDGTVLFTSAQTGPKGEDECFVWILRNTPFSNQEAVRHQGYRVRPVAPA